jgi:hypothetical protein
MNAKDAFHQTVHNAPGGCPALAARLGMSPTILRNKANPNNDVNVVTIDDIDRVMTITEDYAVLHALAQAHGFVLTKIDEQPSSDMCVLESVTDIWQRVGQVGAEVHKALADGRVDAHEVKAVRDVTFKAIASLMSAVECLNGMAEKAGA